MHSWKLKKNQHIKDKHITDAVFTRYDIDEWTTGFEGCVKVRERE
jgi:hypothetical protein